MQGTANQVSPQERKGFSLNGSLVAVVEIILVLVAAGILFSVAIGRLSQPHHGAVSTPVGLLPAFVLILIVLLVLRGFRLVRPDQALVLYSGNHYAGTIRGGGFVWTNPFLSRQKVALHPQSLSVGSQAVTRAQSGGSTPLQAQIIWHVTDTAKALFGAESYVDVLRQEATALLQKDAGRADEGAFREQLQRRVEPLGISVDGVTLRSADKV